jgi:predicted N-formylglutamate amidohydrolase
MKHGAVSCIVTCEHASNRVPARYGTLGLPRRRLQEHIAWDPGASTIARLLAERLRCPLHLGRWSRILVDLNRSRGHEKLMAATTFGVAVPANARLHPDEIERRIRLYYDPYRTAATRDIERALERSDACLHWSMHSFTPAANGVRRDCDVGLLYDPSRRRERVLARRLRPLVAAHGLRVRMNYPYRGTSDGFTTRLRRRLPASRYAALEIETNQSLLRTTADARRVGRLLVDAIASLLD